MPKIISIPRVGNIQFPDGMSDGEIAKVAGETHDAKVIGRVVKFMRDDPQMRDLSISAFHKEMSTISALLEKYPRLALAAYEGIGKFNSQSTAKQVLPVAQ
jgi:hypothetical protein